MAASWVLGPIITFRGVRMPKVGHIEDRGHPIREWNVYDPISGEVTGTEMRRKYLDYSSAIGELDWCLTRVSGVNLSNLSLDPSLLILVSEGERLDSTPLSLGWSAAKRNKFKQALADKGVPIAEVKDGSMLWQTLDILGQKVVAGFKTAGTWTR